jgi:hypothetical protein
MSSQSNSQIVEEGKENAANAIDTVSENMKSATNFVSKKAGELDEQYHLTDKAREAAETVVDEGRKAMKRTAETVAEESQKAGEAIRTSQDEKGEDQH